MQLKPGSDEAVARGCRCPREDNHFGMGRYGDGDECGWYISIVCEMHAIPAMDALLKAVEE